MKQTVTFADFRDAFRRCDRMDNFTYYGAHVLFSYLEQLEEDIGEEFELDVVALCCDYAEDTPEDIADRYFIDISKCDGDADAIRDTVIRHLEDEGALVGTTDTTIVYRQF